MVKNEYLLLKYMDEILDLPILRRYSTIAVVDEAKELNLKMDSKKLHGYTVINQMQSTLYLLMRYKYHYPIFYDDFNFKSKRHSNRLKEIIIREFHRITGVELKITPLHPLEYTNRVVDEFNLTAEQKDQFISIINDTREYFRYSSPRAYIATVVYHILMGITTQTLIAESFHVSSSILRHKHDDLIKMLDHQ